MNKSIKYKITRKLTDSESTAIEVVKKLQNAGYVAYFAGGAVRDELLGIPPHDIDIATSATPKQVEELFPKTFEKGKAFGVTSIMEGDKEFEVTTFRSDIGAVDHRRPEKIEYTNAENDALRRDFTINGLFFDPIKKEIIDYVDGLKDIKRKLIRFIGDPQERIDEDYLRILRAVRFTYRFNFALEENSKKEIIKNAEKLANISAERIRNEFSKILQNNNRARAIKEMINLNLISQILPELIETKNVPQPLEFHSEGDVLTHILLALENINNLKKEPSEELVWAVLLHDISKPQTIGYRSIVGKTSITFFDHDVQSARLSREILERFKFSNTFIDNVVWAISQHMRIVNAFRGMSERKQEKLFLDPNIELLLNLTKADLSASLRPNGKPDLTMYNNAIALRDKFLKNGSTEEKEQAKKFTLITGNDIMKILKITPGPEVGKIKTEIEEMFLEGKINTRDEALEEINKRKI